MKNPSRRSFLKLGAAVAGGAVAFRSVPTWTATGQDAAVVPNLFCFIGSADQLLPMIKIEAKA